MNLAGVSSIIKECDKSLAQKLTPCKPVNRMAELYQMTTKGVLYIVATPIGNLADLTERAINTLANVDLIAAEDTRHSQRLLKHLGINKPLKAYHDHGGDGQTEHFLELLSEGKNLALISDAGTPLISDPGYRLVREARKRGLGVTPVPGACSLVAALSASGLPTDRFLFEGFLPAKSKGRRDVFEEVKTREFTSVFFESPHRIVECLRDAASVFGDVREIVLARELSKTFETFLSGSVREVREKVESDSDQRKGEMVLMIAGVSPTLDDRSLDEETKRVLAILLEELSVKQATKLASKICAAPRNLVYDYAVHLKS